MESEGTSMPYFHTELSYAYLRASFTINISLKNNIKFA